MWPGFGAGVVRRLLGYLLMVYRERQYKRKIKLWNLRKNANVGDYSHIDQLMQAPSKVPLGDVFMSQGIPITDDKIRRYVRHKGKEVPAAAGSQVSPPPASTRDPSTSGRLLVDDEAAHPWSPPIADETAPEPDNGSSTSRLMELLRELRQREDQIANLRRKIELETKSMSNILERNAVGLQDSLDRGKRTGPQQTTLQQPQTQPHYYTRTSQKQEESKGPGHVPPQQAAKAPAPEILAVREANAKKSWRTVTINGAEETNPFEESFKAATQPNRAPAYARSRIDETFGPGAWADVLPLAALRDGKARRTSLLGRQFRALYPEVESSAAVATVTASEPDDLHRGLVQFSVECMPTPCPLEGMPTPGSLEWMSRLPLEPIATCGRRFFIET